ncbi:MAG TPA: tetratricopeptide repeat protein [Pyrinomonadaceae bacterium]
MVFDKTKAMRNAERFVAQGKIQAAIGEYKQVVAHDPKDFGTMNMLGDLYTKNLDKKLAVECYQAVAEHYSKQGFAQKAIAVYNKISRIQPNSIEISEKLADLYKFKGAINEARTHYKIVAEHYEKEGRKLDALEIRKQMASLDPSDTAVYLSLAESYLHENQSDEAADAFSEAAQRFAKKSQHVEALAALERALELKTTDQKILAAFVQSHFALGTPADAAVRLVEIQSSDPHNRDVLELLIDCHIEARNTVEAEKAVISLVEKEPAAYPKLITLARTYLTSADAESAARMTSMSSEHLLLAGETEDLQTLLAEILALDPEQLEALRLSARLAGWLRDETGMHDSLVQLARVAKDRQSIDDERYALSQLAMVAPQNVEFAERLREINEQFGFDDAESPENLFDQQFNKAPKTIEEAPGASDASSEPQLETFAIVAPLSETNIEIEIEDEAISDFAIVTKSAEPALEDDFAVNEDDDDGLTREIDSIRFYIDSEYFELADKAIGELREQFGNRPEIEELTEYLTMRQAGETSDDVAQASTPPVTPAPVSSNGKVDVASGFGIEDLRSELGLDEAEPVDDSDYDTHYHTAVAYQEMGLLDEAIKEFQEAVGLVQPNDPTRRFFQCANLLGHCFMQKAMPNLALTWYQRALETPGLGDEEKQGIWYELASAYEAEGDMENAGRYFEQVYAENIDFRDVSERVKNVSVSR